VIEQRTPLPDALFGMDFVSEKDGADSGETSQGVI
jgi:hypothetical protein